MIKALIVENEEKAANSLMQLIKNHCKEVYVYEVCNTVSKAVDAVVSGQPEIVFLDIELNNGETAFSFLQQIQDPNFEIIFTTAYDQYCLQAIRCSCLEYLLKPIVADDLVAAVQKFNKKKNFSWYKQRLEALLYNLNNPVARGKITIPTLDGFVIIHKAEIETCIAEANYTLIYTSQGEKIISSKNLGFIEDMISGKNFFRTHKSFLVNLDHIKKFERKDGYKLVMKSGNTAEVSSRKKDELIQKIAN